MTFKEKLKKDLIFLDGAMGTELIKCGAAAGEEFEEWNLTRPEDVARVHRAYLAAGSDVIYANTFGANPFKFGARTKEIVAAAIKLAKAEAGKYPQRFVALDVGPLGKLLKPLGALEFEDAVEAFKVSIKAGAEAGADLIAIETMNDCYELKAAVLAAKESCTLPIIATAVFGKDEKTMTGCSPEAFVALAEGLGVDALGVNCSLAPSEMRGVVERILKASSTPVIVKPNAGIPKDGSGGAEYTLPVEEFAADMADMARFGARLVGGCCGTTPGYIAAMRARLSGFTPEKIVQKNATTISSYTHAVSFGGAPVLIGERINPTGKKRLKEALISGDIAYVLNEAVKQEEGGAHVLDVNVGLPGIDERALLITCIKEIQAVTSLPLQIDTSDVAAMEGAMRIYNGKPLINSVNGKSECMRAVFPLVKKYGGCVVCLTLDEGGIPLTAEGRIKIAEKIIKVAEEYGILRSQLIFDTLAMAVSADSSSGNVALQSLSYIRHNLGCNTSLGVSNISFGLPCRDLLNGTFFAMALCSGLSAAIYNPNSQEMQKTYKSYLALTGLDESFSGYIAFAEGAQQPAARAEEQGADDLKRCIVKGLLKSAEACAEKLLLTTSPLDVINGYVIPALDEVGKGFEAQRVYLPQLLMSAEAAGAAFAKIKQAFGGGAPVKKLKIALATVKGDVHDIGKNIVGSVLESYGFSVIDLGRDVAPGVILEKTLASGAQLLGLSALMTTTVRYMAETIALFKDKAPHVKICVGGAVLTEEYASSIGADRYCRDAMDTVRYARELDEKL